MKKLIATIVSVCMIIASFTSVSFAAENDIIYDVNSTTQDEKQDEEKNADAAETEDLNVKEHLLKENESQTEDANNIDSQTSDAPITDTFDDENEIIIYYDEGNPQDGENDQDHYDDGVLSSTFKLDSDKVYVISAEMSYYDNDEYFDDEQSNISISKEDGSVITKTNSSYYAQVYKSSELGNPGDLITVSLAKNKSCSDAAVYFINITAYDGLGDSITLPKTLKMNMSSQDYLIPEGTEDTRKFYLAHYSIDDTTVADIEEYYCGNSVALVITAKKTGTAIITAKLSNGIEYKCSLSVVAGLKYSSKSIYIKSSFKNELYGAKGTVKWSTSNKRIATVSSNGVVKGISNGTATIYAKNGGKTYKCKVVVKNPSMTRKSITPFVKQTYKLGVNGGSGKIKWSSSNKKIAAVSSSGVVTAKKTGSCKIYAVRNGKKTSCTVKVYSKMTMNKTSYDLEIDDIDACEYETVELSVTGGEGPIEWTSSNAEIAEVSEGYVKPNAEGNVTITAKRYGYTAKCNITVTDYSNVVYADSYQWDCLYVFSNDIDEDGWYIKFRPEKTGYIRVSSLENSADIYLIDKDDYIVSNDCTVWCDEYDSEDVIWGVKKGQAYYLYVSSVYDSEYNDENVTAVLSITNNGITNKCGYSKKTAKTLSKSKTVYGAHYAGECKAHWYKFKLKKASNIRVKFANRVNPDAYITVYKGFKVISYGGSDGRCFEFGESDTLSSNGKLGKGTYYIRIDTYDDCCSGYYSLKWY